MSNTSRATNQDWYANALELDFQLHLRVDGESLRSLVYHAPTDNWQAGPSVSPDLLNQPALHHDLVQRTLAMALEAGAKSLGVIIHVADEFATAEIKPSLDNRGELPELQKQIATDPGTVLADSAVAADQFSWRLVPYAVAGSGSIATAITLTRHAEGLLEAFRLAGEANDFPIVTSALSAPLEALSAIPWLWAPHENRPLIAVLHYAAFTVLAFFDNRGELILVRTMQHRGQRRPSNLRHAASTTATVLELDQPDVLVFPLGNEEQPAIVQDLQQGLLDSRIEVIDWNSTPFVHASITAHAAMEPLISRLVRKPAVNPKFSNETFHSLIEENIAYQNFLPTAEEIRAIYPEQAEMKLLGNARLARIAAIVIAGIGIAWFATSWISLKGKTSDFDPKKNQEVQAQIGKLNQEKTSTEQWDRLLEDRSKAWVNMELLHILFPDRSGVMLRKVDYRVTPVSAGIGPKGAYTREWKINGAALQEGVELLNALNDREGLNLRFEQIAKTTGNWSFKTDLPSRSITINLKLTENTSFRPNNNVEDPEAAANSYPYIFDLTIVQRFELNDPMALSTPTPTPAKPF